MEVDGKEFAQSRDATFDDLPNEILLTIFAKLDFPDLLSASVVCTRWNNVIFHFFNHRIAFRLHSFFVPLLSGTRSYRNVRITGRYLYSPQGQNENRLAALAEDAWNLHLELSEIRGGVLARLLNKFSTLRSLSLRIMRYCSERSPQLFRRLIRGVLPALKSLTLVCLTFYCMEVLAEVAPTLESLNIKLLARHRLKLYECNLASLRSLTLSMDTRSMMYLYNLEEFPVDEFITFLSGLPNLRVLRLKLDHPEAFLHIYSLRNIVELSLGGLDPAAQKCSLDGISQMVNLKTLSITAQELLLPSVLQPATTVTSLTLHDLATMDIKKLARVFPSLTVFCVETPRSLMLSELRQIVVAWRALEELSVRIERLSEEICDCFLKLSKLRKLTLHGFLLLLKSGPFEKIITMPSLKRLYLNDSAWGAYFNYLPAACNRAYPCQLYLNGLHV
ncbi:uncharacterized protein LOC120416976 [Culex pipiens pallens]|uniref:uncharacterized protein LOC120416976 n=1 Tax=Culex pipiens pallens TaxID=42434 RepID=UPI001953C181|nr:uncharacterized protein LOC120416976 [Culex pipiens pallens]